MKTIFFNAAGFAVIAFAAAAPALAIKPAPEPEVAGGLLALAAMGIGYRVLKRLIAR